MLFTKFSVTEKVLKSLGLDVQTIIHDEHYGKYVSDTHVDFKERCKHLDKEFFRVHKYFMNQYKCLDKLHHHIGHFRKRADFDLDKIEKVLGQIIEELLYLMGLPHQLQDWAKSNDEAAGREFRNKYYEFVMRIHTLHMLVSDQEFLSKMGNLVQDFKNHIKEYEHAERVLIEIEEELEHL